MELTILLSQVFGIYLIIGGAAIMLRKSHFIPVVGAFVEERLLRLVVAMAELTGGLFLVLTHNVWTTFPEGIISLFGWMLVIEGTAYLILPDSVIAKMINAFNKPWWYVGGGILAIACGVYLAGFGFGWF